MARRPRFTQGSVADALRASAGIYTHAAKMLDCAPNTIRGYVERYPGLRAVKAEIDEQILDLAESVLLRHIRDESLQAAVFYLRTKGRARGYGDKLELGGKVKTATIDLRGATLEEVRSWAEWDGDETPPLKPE